MVFIHGKELSKDSKSIMGVGYLYFCSVIYIVEHGISQ